VKRVTGKYRQIKVYGNPSFAFIPHPLLPSNPPFKLDENIKNVLLPEIAQLVKRYEVLAASNPAIGNLNHVLVYKEAVLSSQVAGIRATLRDVLEFEATGKSDHQDQVRQVLDYVDALSFARGEIFRSSAIRIDMPLLSEIHSRLTKDDNAAPQQTQTRPGGPNQIRLGPPTDQAAAEVLDALQRWLNAPENLRPLIREGLALGQFTLISPFAGGNDRIARLLAGVLMENWKWFGAIYLCPSALFKRRHEEYQERLTLVRTDGDWEEWITFYVQCLRDAMEDGISTAQRALAQMNTQQALLIDHAELTIPTLRLFSKLPRHPYMTLALALKLLDATKPTASRAIDLLRRLEILREITGQQRDRVYVYQSYVDVLTKDTE
jgi:Fic family protein